ncbi:MAG: GspE/PulE/PilB domain-containing protein [Myxococcales bacterium]
MAKIGEVLIRAGHLTQDGLEEALDWQVLYGGRLGTNLVELRLVEEEQLARALGKQLGAEVAWGELAVDPALVSAIPRHVADRHEIVPWKLEKRRLKVLCSEIKVNELDQISYKTGRTCVPVIAPEFRIFQLLRAHYQATRQMRALDFGVVPEEGRAERRRQKGKQAEKPVEKVPELIDETAFNLIYNQVVQGRTGPIAIASPEREPERPAPAKHPAAARRARKTPEPPPVAARPPPPPEPDEEILEALPDDAILEELPADAVITDAVQHAIAAAQPEPPLKKVSWDDVPQTPPPPRRDESPLDFKQALRALDGVSDRNAIAHIVLRASRNKAARALLLQVQGGVALGWDGLGEGTEHASQVAMPLATESAFSLVVKTRSHYMGPLQKTPANIRFLAMLGKKVPLSALIFPILHRGRVSHMLYLDNGHRQQAPTDVGEMLILSQRIGQTVDALVARTRKAARA